MIEPMLKRLLPAHACLAALVCAQPDAPPVLRLGNNVVPTGYKVSLSLDPVKESFSGTVDIDLRVANPVQTIWLHAKELEITDTTCR
jgi:alanyl aminopeptidase